MMAWIAFTFTVLLSLVYVGKATGEKYYENLMLKELENINLKLSQVIENQVDQTSLVKSIKSGIPSPNHDDLEPKDSRKPPVTALTLKKKHGPHRLDRYGVSINEDVPLILTIGSCKGIIIQFMKTSADNAELMNLWVGINGKTMVVDCFKKGLECAQAVKLVKKDIWTCGKSTTLWIKWTNTGFVSLGKGSEPGTNTVIEYQGSKEVNEIKYIGLFAYRSDNVAVTVQPYA